MFQYFNSKSVNLNKIPFSAIFTSIILSVKSSRNINALPSQLIVNVILCNCLPYLTLHEVR